MTTFWDVAPCSLVKETDVSEVRIASIIRAMMEATWRMPCLFLAEAQTIFVASYNLQNSTHDYLQRREQVKATSCSLHISSTHLMQSPK
jgi:hypothetical protein